MTYRCTGPGLCLAVESLVLRHPSVRLNLLVLFLTRPFRSWLERFNYRLRFVAIMDTDPLRVKGETYVWEPIVCGRSIVPSYFTFDFLCAEQTGKVVGSFIGPWQVVKST